MIWWLVKVYFKFLAGLCGFFLILAAALNFSS